MELAELLRIQDALDLRDTHLIHFARDGFAIAHTDVERAAAKRAARPFDLENCPFHAWASDLEPEGRWSGSGLWTMNGGDDLFGPWPNLVALDILSRSPHPRPKLAASRVCECGSHLGAEPHTVTGGWSPDQVARAVRDYNAMVDELEILSAALVAKGADPKRVLEAWRGEG